ncbi:cytochrome P450 [Lophiotrema nucula]|uniref:Cytochrome P450 n=1 Tax=Lophiotrema nucula TaxID=690887 RepID=A0A6A5Z818_9PLEO|nr:cytochrome P450 [Lophiotrema nucula]
MSHLTNLLIEGAVLFTSLGFIYTFGLCFYNVFLHPLRSYPGPLFSRASVFEYHRQCLKGRLPFWLHDLHKKYGPVVRYGPNEISFIEAAVWKDAYGHSQQATSFEKHKPFYGPDIFGSSPGLIRADNYSHGRQRRLASHAFSDKALKDQEGILKGYATMLIDKLKEATQKNIDGKVDVVDFYNFTTFDIMADLTFGEPLGLLEGAEFTPWVRTFFENLKLIQITFVLRAWPALQAMMNAMVPKSLMEKRKLHMKHTTDRVDKRLARKTERPDIWTYITRFSESEENKDKNLTESESYSNAGLFMSAGTETTATTLCGLTYFLLHNPEKLERLKKEVREAFPTYDDIHMTQLSQLEYLNACIEEGLRMYPPVSMGLPRTAPKGGAEVGGHWVSEGTCVGLTHYAAYHSPSNFKDPDDYVPERWLPEGQTEYGSDHKDVLQPFSYGPRNCLGKNLAWHEMRLILTSVLWHYDLEFCPESEDWFKQDYYVLWKKPAMMVKLKSIRE